MEFSSLQQRLLRYARNRKIYKGGVFELVRGEYSPEDQKKYLSLNFARKIVDIPVRLLMGKPPRFFVQSDAVQEHIDRIVFNTDLVSKIALAAIEGQVSGDIVLRVGFNKEARIDFITADNYTVEVSPEDASEIVCNVLTFENSVNGHTYRRVERDYENVYVTQRWEKRPNEASFELVDESEVRHNAGFLVQKISFFPSLGESWGNSVYDGLEDILLELNNRASRVRRVLDMFSSPKLMVPRNIFEQLVSNTDDVAVDRFGNKYVSIGDTDVWLLDEDEKNKPEYLTWNAENANSFEFFRMMLGSLSFLTDIPADFLEEANGAPQSGRALKIRLLQTLYRSAEIGSFLAGPIKRALYLAQKLEIAYGSRFGAGLKPEWVEVDWLSSLPLDEEEVKIEVAKFDAGLQSREMTIRKINGLSARQLTDELKKIDEDKQREIAFMERQNAPFALDGVLDG